MNLEAFSLRFPEQYLRAALMVSLLSVWLLVGLFYYLNRYTKRQYFTIWTAAWLFYALWLTLSLEAGKTAPGSLMFMVKQSCVAISAVFLMWGSLRFLGLPTRQTSFGLFMLFVVLWTLVSPRVLATELQIQLPVFMLLGLGSVFAGTCFYRLRKKMPYVGAGMLALGFFLWGVYLVSYPLSQEFGELYSAGFFAAAVLQLFIAVSMIVLVLEEVRYNAEQVMTEITAVRSEKEQLQLKVLTTEEQCRDLYDRVRLSEGRQQAYDELRRTQQAVVQQERLRALGQMASGIAHDINNALSPIVAYADLLLQTIPNLAENARRQLQIIRCSGEDIAHLVARLREFYRPRSGNEQLLMVNLNQVIEEVVELSRPRWRDLPQREGASIEIVKELEPNLPLLRSDPTELREALLNLVFNAVDALARGGTITLRSRQICGPATPETPFPERQIQVEVQDNGVGMEETVRQRCLEPFFSTKAQRGGSGLGLAMVYGMIRRHEGAIEIESAPGRGTCVRLAFPLRPVLASNGSAQPDRAEPNRALQVLCIDDDPQIQQLLKDCLTGFQHRVAIAASGRQGVEMFRAALQRSEPYEAVITDLGMPDFDGYQVVRAIKAQSPKTPVIMLTGWGETIKQDQEPMLAADALVSKPPQVKHLNNTLLELTRPDRSPRQA